MAAPEPAPEHAPEAEGHHFPDAYSLGKWEDELAAVAVLLGLMEPEKVLGETG